MMRELFLLGGRFYLWGILVLILNAVSRFAFKPRVKRITPTLTAICFTPFWPLGIFSKEGRKVLFNKLEKL